MGYNYNFEEFSRNGDKIIVRRSVYIDNCLPMHGHNNFMEIVYIDSGEGTHYLNGKEYKVKEGDLILLAYNSVHTFRPVTCKFEWINVLYRPEFINDKLINEMSEGNVIKLSLFRPLLERSQTEESDILLTGINDSFSSLIHLMLDEYNRSENDNNYILKSYLIILLSKVSILLSGRKKNPQAEVNVLVKHIVSEIENHLQDDLTLSFIADKVHLNAKYLSRFFKQQMGVNFIDYVHGKRIEEACRLLSITDMSVNDIMLCCGMKSPKFFYKLFKEKTGVTPGDYRRQK